jgi:hypothetical protein
LQPSSPTGLGQLASRTKLSVKREDAGRLTALSDGERCRIDQPVAVPVEVALLQARRADRRDELGADLKTAGAREHDRAEHRLFGVEVLRRDLLDGHAAASRVMRSASSMTRRASCSSCCRQSSNAHQRHEKSRGLSGDGRRFSVPPQRGQDVRLFTPPPEDEAALYGQQARRRLVSGDGYVR